MGRWDFNDLLETIDSDITDSEHAEFFETMSLADQILVKPSKYDGTRDARKLKSWLSEVENFCETYVPDRSNWVSYAKRFLLDSAYYWYKQWNPDNLARPWSEFVQAIKLSFLPKGFTTQAIRKLMNIRYETSILNYNVEFMETVSDLPPNFQEPGVLIFHYKEGLPRPILTDIMRQGEQTLEELMVRAQEWEQTNPADSVPNIPYDRNVGRYAPPKNRSRPVGSRKSNYAGSTYRGPVGPDVGRSFYSPSRGHVGSHRPSLPAPEPMDLSVIRRVPMTAEERYKLYEEGLCFHCRTGKHYAYDCPWRNTEQKN